MILFENVANGVLADATRTMYPTLLHGLKKSSTQFSEVSSTFYGYIISGEALLTNHESRLEFKLKSGMYFVSSGPIELKAQGEAIVVERRGYRGLFQIGGPVESEGRLAYIDNCRTSLLVSPARAGDPCLNLLTFPKDLMQSQHLHPTIRVGAVIEGSGYCWLDKKKIPLKKGQWFFLGEGEQHGFQSGSNGLKVIAFHPDSDWGPTDQAHPMLNRTYLVKTQQR